MNILTAFPTKYVSSADLQGQEVPVVMSHVALEDIEDGKDKLPVLYFQGMQKGLVLNKTNAKTLSDSFGPETDAWSGRGIILFSMKVQFGKDIVDGIRVKANFAQQQPVQPTPQPVQPVQQPAPQPPQSSTGVTF